jgi:purine-binding chemotaxis protein CheW
MSTVHVRLRVGAERYALPVDHVLEVADLRELSVVPGAGVAVLGVCNLRGHVLPVFDLAQVLAISAGPAAVRIVVAEHAGRVAGLAVADVTDVGELAGHDEESDAPYLSGAVLEQGRLVGILDVERLFGALSQAAA